MTFDEYDPAAGEALREPRHVAALSAANNRPGHRDDDGQLHVDRRSASVQIVCASDHRGGSCGRYLGGVWRTSAGTVLVYKKVRPDAREFIQHYKGRRRGPVAPKPGDRYPDDLLTTERYVLVQDAEEVMLSCVLHGSWPLDLIALQRRLNEQRALMRGIKLASKPV